MLGSVCGLGALPTAVPGLVDTVYWGLSVSGGLPLYQVLLTHCTGVCLCLVAYHYLVDQVLLALCWGGSVSGGLPLYQVLLTLCWGLFEVWWPTRS